MSVKTLCARGCAVGLMLLAAGTTHAQLRVVTYNTNTFQTGFPDGVERFVRDGVVPAIQALGEEQVNGIARPADIILLQEQQRPVTTTQNLVDQLNAIYGDGFYARGFEVGATTGGSGFGPLDGGEIRQAVIYRTDSVQLLDEDSFGGISGPTQPRETLFYQFRPIGYGADADLFIFNSHFEAGDGTGFGDDLFARENEATDIRDFITSNSLGSSNVIVAGDLNVDSNFELSGTTTFGGRSSLQILSDGTDAEGRVLDPLFPDGGDVTFSFNFGLADQLTQSPADDGPGPLTGGGIDDRFDFILTSDELLDDDGVALIPDSYHVFGNNGSTFNDQINDGNTISINGLTSFTTAEVLDALESGSDHLPVVADFQLPAVLDAIADAVPATLAVGEEFDLGVTITNAAAVATVNGADELDYTLSVAGDLVGAASGTDAALGGGVLELVGLDTSSVVLKSGVITVETSSQGAANALVTIPVSFEVIAAMLTGDFNADGFVGQADLNLVLLNFGATVLPDGFDATNTTEGFFDGLIGQNELNDVLLNFGNGALPETNAIPEPGVGAALGVALLAGLGSRRRVAYGREVG
ncbi:MAG: hypothetical protein AAF333_01455 [Planctomycetota bacterium]